LLTLTCMQSCVMSYESLLYFNNEEIIKINPNMSGEYSMRLDLHDIFVDFKKIPDSMPDNVMKDFVERINMMKIDTTIFFSNEIRQLRTLSNSEKLMFNDGRLEVSVNPAEEKGLVTIKLFFNNINQFNFDREHIWSFIVNNFEFGFDLPFISKGLHLSDKNSLNYKVIQEPEKINPNSLFSNPISSFTTLKTSNKKIENVLNTLFSEMNLEIKKLISNLKADSLHTAMVFYKTTLVLPSEIKKYNGNGSLSTDKKTITYKNSLKDILNNLHQLEFSLEYQ
ncbi:MAG: hypothetical protein ABUT20_10550, partial [Bacteroidota bacterium]